ncbi:MAG: AAA family ATPase, partial [Actinomycetota bacterium]
MAPVLQVQMLGGFDLEVEGQTLPPLSSRSAASLLAFLALNRDRPHTRDLLAGRFWSDLAEDVARRRLSNALWRIKSTMSDALGDLELVQATKANIRINPEVELRIDVEEFANSLDELERRRQVDPRGVTAADLAAVVDGYRGDLMAGYYHDWVEMPRKQIGNRYLDAVSQLVRMYSGAADYEPALRYAQVLVAAEPLVEEWQRDVIRLYALNGQPSAAEQHFARYADALKAELGGTPSRETLELLERIRSDATPPVAATMQADDGPKVLVGREQERAQVLGRVNELLDGRGGVVLIEGEAGIGKSRLVDEVAAGAKWRDVQVMVGTHSATSTLTPFSGLRAALEPMIGGLRGERLATQVAPVWLRQASTVLPGLGALVAGRDDPALRPQEEPWRTNEALARVLLAQGKPNPAVLILEDVHWCDDDTLQVLTHLGDRLASSGLLLFLTYQRHEAQKSEQLWRALGELEARPGSSRVVLGPLADDQVRDLVAAELGPGRVSEPALAQLAKTSVGNPYVVLELLRSATDVLDEDFFARAASAEESGSILPWLSGVLAQRMSATSVAAREVMEAVATVGGAVGTPVLSRITGVAPDLVIDALQEAVGLGFLTETPKGCEFVQDQSRQLIYDEIDPARRVSLHGSVVDALVGVDAAGVEQLAYHAARAEQWPRAYQYHSLAAEAALRANAFQTAAEHFSIADDAARAAGLRDRDRADDLLATERVLDVLGRREQQQILLDRLDLAEPRAPVALESVQRRAWLLANTDRGADAADLAEAAVSDARRNGLNVGELLTIVGVARAWSGDLAGSIAPLKAAIEELEQDGRSSVNAEVMLGRTLADLGHPDEAKEHLDRAYLEAKGEHDARAQVEALGHLATLHDLQRNEVQAETSFLEALHLAVEIGYRHGEGLNLVNLLVFYYRQGRAGKALGLLDRATEVFVSLGNGRGVAFVQMNGADLYSLIGDYDTAASLAEEAAVYFRSTNDTRREAMCLSTLANIDLRRGRRPLARRRLDAARQQGSAGDDPENTVEIHLTSALVELELGHLDGALEEVERAEELRAEHALEATAAAALVTEARIRLARGEADRAVELVNAAIPHNGPRAELAHLTAWHSAEILTECGQLQAGRDQVVLAHQLLSRSLEELPEPMVERAWTTVPEHRAMAEARDKFLVDEVEWRLPSADAPTGRPLESVEFVDIIWTVSHPDDWQVHSATARRQKKVERMVAE